MEAAVGKHRSTEVENKAKTIHDTRRGSLKKEALRGLQEIQATISNTYHFGAEVKELEQLSEDARNAFEGADYQEVILYVDQTEEVSRRVKIAHMDSIILEIQESGENTEYLEYLIREAENAYNNERFKVGDEICRRFIGLIRELEYEESAPKRSKIYCRYCGNAAQPDSRFCTICGEKLW